MAAMTDPGADGWPPAQIPVADEAPAFETPAAETPAAEEHVTESAVTEPELTAQAPDVAELAQDAASAGEPAPVLRVLQRVVFPSDDLDVVPLYAETKMERGSGELTAEVLMSALGKNPPPAMGNAGSTANAISGEAQTSIRFGVANPEHPYAEVLPRRTAAINGSRSPPTSTRSRPATGAGGRRWTRSRCASGSRARRAW
jgi:hypothetical protein